MVVHEHLEDTSLGTTGLDKGAWWEEGLEKPYSNLLSQYELHHFFYTHTHKELHITPTCTHTPSTQATPEDPTTLKSSSKCVCKKREMSNSQHFLFAYSHHCNRLYSQKIPIHNNGAGEDKFPSIIQEFSTIPTTKTFRTRWFWYDDSNLWFSEI